MLGVKKIQDEDEEEHNLEVEDIYYFYGFRLCFSCLIFNSNPDDDTKSQLTPINTVLAGNSTTANMKTVVTARVLGFPRQYNFGGNVCGSMTPKCPVVQGSTVNFIYSVPVSAVCCFNYIIYNIFVICIVLFRFLFPLMLT